jgi:mannose PTS system EIIA component
MPGLLIIAHAPFASALQTVAAHIDSEKSQQLQAVDVSASMSTEEIERLLLQALEKLHQPQVLILCDVFGATPFNVALRFAKGSDVGLVTGVNVAMLWRCMSYAHKPLGELLEIARAGGVNGIQTQPMRETLSNAP